MEPRWCPAGGALAMIWRSSAVLTPGHHHGATRASPRHLQRTTRAPPGHWAPQAHHQGTTRAPPGTTRHRQSIWWQPGAAFLSTGIGALRLCFSLSLSPSISLYLSLSFLIEDESERERQGQRQKETRRGEREGHHQGALVVPRWCLVMLWR